MSKTKGSPGMKALLNKVMGTDKSMTEEEALANLKPEETAETKSLLHTVNSTVENVNASLGVTSTVEATSTVTNATVMEKAYNITFDSNTRKYSLHEVEYDTNGNARYVGSKELSRHLPEASHALTKIMIDKLQYSMNPNWKIKAPKK